ncbi:MAG TPA: hypothetical protein VKG45_04505 [Actinomycetes bacterium]|nr:hypothetical protein [Actinomycetes bacterium]
MPPLTAGAHAAPGRHRGRILASLLTLTLAAAGLATVVHYGSPAAHAGAGANTLGPNEQLDPNQLLVSTNGQYTLETRTDGVVLWGPGRTRLWYASTMESGGATVQNRAEGSIVLLGPGNRVATTIASGPPGTVLVLEDSGKLVATAPDGSRVFATRTWPPPTGSPGSPSGGGGEADNGGQGGPDDPGPPDAPPPDGPPEGGGLGGPNSPPDFDTGQGLCCGSELPGGDPNGGGWL